MKPIIDYNSFPTHTSSILNLFESLRSLFFRSVCLGLSFFRIFLTLIHTHSPTIRCTRILSLHLSFSISVCLSFFLYFSFSLSLCMYFFSLHLSIYFSCFNLYLNSCLTYESAAGLSGGRSSSSFVLTSELKFWILLFTSGRKNGLFFLLCLDFSYKRNRSKATQYRESVFRYLAS